MVEPTTAIGAGLVVLGSRDVLNKLLGPTADYLGGEARNLVDRCNINLDRIFQKAQSRVGEAINQPGTVNPRVLKHVIDEGRFCEDELAAEYFGGLLASARTPDGVDDRAVSLVAMVKDLSVYQIRFHHMAYTLFSELFCGSDENLGKASNYRQLRVFIPFNVYTTAMQCSEDTSPFSLLGHCLFGLGRADLISNFLSGMTEDIQKELKGVSEGGIVVAPTLLGAELFLWSHGVRNATGRELFVANVERSTALPTLPSGAVRASDVTAAPTIDE